MSSHPHMAYMDLVSFLACVVAAVLLVRGWKRGGFLPAVPILLLILLLLKSFYSAALFLQWSGFETRLDWLEDFAGLFIPFTWAFVFYALIKNAVEEDIEAGREHFRNLVESTGDWIWEVDAEGRYTYASPHITNILGYTPEEVIGKTPFDLMPSAEAERLSSFYGRIFEDQEPFQNLENINLHKGGREVVLETNGNPVFDSSGKLIGYRGVDRDITRRLENERLQKKQQAEIDSVFKASPVGIGLVRNRYLVRANERFFEITGYPKDELLGTDPRRFYLTDEDYLAVSQKYTEAIEDGSARIETRFAQKDQTVIDVVIYIAPLLRTHEDAGFAIILQDITEIKAARQAAAAEKTRAQMYLDVVSVMILVLDADGRIELINKKGCDLLGCVAEEVAGSDWFRRFVPGSYRDISRSAFQRILDGDEKAVAYFEGFIRTAAGDEKLMAWHNAALRDESGRIVGVISSGNDITESRASEEAMRESEERLRVAMSAAAMGTWRWSAATNRLTRDASLNALLGAPKARTISGPDEFFSFVHPDDSDGVRQEFDRAIRERDTYLARYRIRQTGDSVRWVLDQGKPFYDYNGQLEYLTGVTLDITELKQAEQRFLDAEQRNRTWLENSPVCTKILDLDFNLQYMSRAGVVGLKIKDVTEFYGKPYPFDFFPESFKNTMIQSLEKARDTREVVKLDSPVVDTEGNELWYHATIVPVLDEKDQVDYIIVVSTNITELKAAEQEREALMQQIRNRNDELQSIVFTAAHDLRSPLVNIAGFTGELEKGLSQLTEVTTEASLDAETAAKIDFLLKNDLPESLRLIKFGNQQMEMLLGGLMRLSRVGSAPMKLGTLDMNEMLKAVVRGFQYKIKTLGVDVSIQDDLPACIGDYSLQAQVFINLLDNAIKYRRPDCPPVIRLGGSLQGDMAEYTVTDNGIGIEPEQADKVFDLFHRLDRQSDAGDGEGLGLTIVRRILDRQHGAVRIDSTPGQGTTVFVRLPRA